MSYILDALKKSEKQRQRGAVPGVLTAQDVRPIETRKRPLWPYLISAVLLLSVALLVLWFMPHRTGRPPTSGQTAIQKDAVPDKTAAQNITLSEEEPVRTKPQNGTSTSLRVSSKTGRSSPVTEDEKPTLKVTEETASPVEPEVPQDIPAPAPDKSTASEPMAEQKPTDALIPPPEDRIYKLTELPQVIREGLPQFTISTHVYSSDPTSRLTRINGQTLREGEELLAGLKLEEITSDGVILRYKNYRFRIGLR